MSVFSLPIGYQFENYMIEGELGAGGFGVTYLARDVALDTKFAIKEYIPSEFAYRGDNYKVLPKSNSDKDIFEWGLNSFLDEARTLVRFNDCENIVKVYRYFEANGTAYFVMEYIEGDTFAEILKKNLLSPNQIENIFFGALNGLKRIHQSKVLHKDIKPSNIMIKGETPVLIDFGSARKNTPGKEHTKIITERYSPIEQYNENQEFGYWTDIYSLSATFYRAIVGQAPPEATSRVISDNSMVLSYEKPYGYSQGFLNLIDEGLKILPKNRPQSIASWEDSYLTSKKKFTLPNLSFFSFKRSENFFLNLFRGGFIASGIIAFFAIGSMIFSYSEINFNSEKNEISSKENENIKVQSNIEVISKDSKSSKIPNKTFYFPIKKSPWKTLKLSDSFDLGVYSYVLLKSEFPFRIRHMGEDKPTLIKRQVKYKVSRIGNIVDIKTVNDGGATLRVDASKD